MRLSCPTSVAGVRPSVLGMAPRMWCYGSSACAARLARLARYYVTRPRGLSLLGSDREKGQAWQGRDKADKTRLPDQTLAVPKQTQWMGEDSRERRGKGPQSTAHSPQPTRWPRRHRPRGKLGTRAARRGCKLEPRRPRGSRLQIRPV